jgi:ABC-2 type transport system ATP-binding protein
MKILLGLIRPNSGRATITGKTYQELNDPIETVGALMEEHTFHPGRTGRAHLRILATAADLPSERIGEVLRLVELENAADRKVNGYSMGMKQRLGLAAALLGNPSVLVLDEPANGLDPQGIHWLRNLLKNYAREGKTVFISSHVLSEVAQIADEVVVINEGRMIVQAPLSQLIKPGDNLEEVFISLVADRDKGGSKQ